MYIIDHLSSHIYQFVFWISNNLCISFLHTWLSLVAVYIHVIYTKSLIHMRPNSFHATILSCRIVIKLNFIFFKWTKKRCSWVVWEKRFEIGIFKFIQLCNLSTTVVSMDGLKNNASNFFHSVGWIVFLLFGIGAMVTVELKNRRFINSL